MPTIDELIKHREGLRSYLLLKFHQEDHHGIADAAMDIREIDAKIELLREQQANAC